MSLREGERVVIVHRLASGWWYAHRVAYDGSLMSIATAPAGARRRHRATGEIDFSTQGYVPGAYLEVTDAVYPTKTPRHRRGRSAPPPDARRASAADAGAIAGPAAVAGRTPA